MGVLPVLTRTTGPTCQIKPGPRTFIATTEPLCQRSRYAEFDPSASFSFRDDEDVSQSWVAMSHFAWRHIPADDIAVAQVTSAEWQTTPRQPTPYVNLFHARDGDPFVLQSRSNSGDGSHLRDVWRHVWFGNLIAQDPLCSALHQPSRD